MFLKPLQQGDPVPPLVVETRRGGASVGFADGVPLVAGSGAARFTVEARRRRPFRRPAPVELVAPDPTTLPLREGDVLRLSIGDAAYAWRYDPDGNLSRPMRALAWLAREGTFAAAVAAVVALAVHVGVRNGEALFGTTSAGNPIPALLRENAARAYPASAKDPSPYLRALAEAKQEGRDVAQASREWLAANPVAAPSEGESE